MNDPSTAAPVAPPSRYPAPKRVAAVFFDIGETLIDETEMWGRWAEWLDVPRLTFFAALGTVLARGLDRLPGPGRRAVLRETLRLVRPDLDFTATTGQHADAGPGFTTEDLYTDVAPCLSALRESGYRIGIAGNQPAAAAPVLRSSNLPFEWLLISELEGVHKPNPAFFERIASMARLPASLIAYVGDRVDNDVLPALGVGMVAVHIRRGPWGVVHAEWPYARRAMIHLVSLHELPAKLNQLEIAAGG